MVGPIQVLVVKTKPRTSKAGFLQDELGCAGEVTNWPCYRGVFLEGWVRTKTKGTRDAASGFSFCLLLLQLSIRSKVTMVTCIRVH